MRSHIIKLHGYTFDQCYRNNSSGCIEICYPASLWDYLASWSGCSPETIFEADQKIPANTEVIAYGGDSMWVALKMRPFVTASNYPKLYFIQHGPNFLDAYRRLTHNPALANLFVMSEDAERWANRAGLDDFTVKEIKFNFLVQYQDGPIWQHQRYFSTQKGAEAAWKRYMQVIPSSTLDKHVWQLVDLAKSEVISEYKPAQTDK